MNNGILFLYGKDVVSSCTFQVAIEDSERKQNIDLAHTHDITGKKEITIHNGLAVGDEVILLKQKGGQKYLVLDRVVNA